MLNTYKVTEKIKVSKEAVQFIKHKIRWSKMVH